MDRLYREGTSTIFTRLAHSIGKKQRPVIGQFPVAQSSPSTISRVSSLDQSPAPQTSISTDSYYIGSSGRLLSADPSTSHLRSIRTPG